ncbi:MAG: alcohol dehydrogenase catalytic domain-containing protein [Isosphaeraceae bacterium]
MTRTTRAVVFEGPGLPLIHREFSLPAPSGSEILVEVVACTLCGSDLHSLHGRRTVPTPTILGHEILGRIIEFGPEATRRDAAGRPLRPGDRVTWGVVAHCGQCFYCRRELSQKCERQVKYGHEAIRPRFALTGGLAEHCLLASGTSVLRIPDNLPDAVACPANCATATVAAAIEAAGSIEGRWVLVMGAGMLGVTAMAWARTLGAEAVIACDRVADRCDLSRHFGVTQVVSPEELSAVTLEITRGHGVDVILEMTGEPESIEAALPLLRLGGRLVLVGSVAPTRPVSLFPEQVVRRCLTLRGIHNYGPVHLQAALDFLETSSPFPFESLVSPWQPLNAVDRLVAAPLAPVHLRLGIRPHLPS